MPARTINILQSSVSFKLIRPTTTVRVVGTLTSASSTSYCSSPSDRGRPRIDISVNGISTRALIDTGSSFTLLDYEVFSRLPRKQPLLPAPRLLSISGDELLTIGSTIVNLAQPQSVIVCRNLGIELLLGTDVLKDCILDLPNHVLKYRDQSYSIDMSDEVATPLTSAVTSVPTAQSPDVQKVIDEFAGVFSDKATPVSIAKLPPADIVTTCEVPIRQQSYRIPYTKRETVNTCIDEMLRDKVIQPSHSPWASPILLVPKKDGSVRFCVDYRKLNSVTRKDAHPLPHIKDVFDSLQGATIFSTLDLKSGYWQVPMSPESIPRTAFTCFRGLYEFVRMPFGLANAPAIFQRAMNEVLSGLIGRIVMVYIDDIVVYSRSTAEHAEHLRQVFQRLKDVGLQAKPSKCSFELEEIELLGHIVSAKGLRPLPAKVEAITNLERPKDVKSVRTFLGMTGYYQNHVPDYAKVASPLTELTKKNHPFIWGEEQQEAFDILKRALVNAPILAHPDPQRPYALYTDASDKAVGAILVQKDEDDQEKVIAYLSHKLSGPQLRWPTIEKEAFAIVYALRKFHCYLWGAKFEIHTDHRPLRSLFKAEIKNAKIQRWALNISAYSAPILYHPGKLNIRADMLSRICTVQAIPEQPKFELNSTPEIWRLDKIDPNELSRLQQEEFLDQWIEAGQEMDISPFHVDNGVLYSLAEPYPRAGRYSRVMLPHSFRQGVIDRCHAEVAHAAFAKTLTRVQEHYVWPGMRKAVRKYIAQCTKCCTLSPTKKEVPRGELPTPPRPWHTWGMDLVGPFPRDQRGKQYLLTIIDHLTGWAEAIPIASKKARTVWDAFNRDIVARYGVPAVLVTDNGTEFTSKSFKSWLRDWGVDHRVSSPYHPQTNGKVERFNGTVQKLLLKLSGGNPRRWTDFLSEALYAYRTTNNATDVSPYLAAYGMKPRVPRCPTTPTSNDERLNNLHASMEFLKEDVRRQKCAYGCRETPQARALLPGTFVSVRVLSPKKGQPKWQPGYQIFDSRGPALRLRNVESGVTLRLNQKDVREIPDFMPYKVVDPLPPKKAHRCSDLPQSAAPIVLPELPTVCSLPRN